MRSTLHPSLYPQGSVTSRVAGYSDAIEWEELPSLSDSLDRRLINPEAGQKGRPIVPSVLGAAWDHTMPAELDVLPPPSPFQETLEGLSMREVYEPELFRHFFGEGTVRG
jgi:hypothetical protein